jgi:hypothetical protein
MESNILLRYWYTVRYLQARQIYGQIWRRFFPLRLLDSINTKPSLARINLASWLKRPKSYFGKGDFCFLNRSYDLGWPIDWDAPGLPKLWQYHLHYFDYLHQPDIDADSGLALIRSWIQRHSPRKRAVGWEPYPVSLRLVNWLKFLSKAPEVSADILESLYLQASNLNRQVEYHILGNHLFANGKALWWAGIFLNEEKWIKKGRTIVLHEMDEQFLPDGGHFELSPMYHALAVEDILDLINLCESHRQNAKEESLKALRKKASTSLGWFRGLADKNGYMPLLNDSVYGISPTYEELESYASRLRVPPCDEDIPSTRIGSWSGQSFSGYWVLRHAPFRLVFDTAPLGPDYLPAHAHCDMLAVLLDYAGKNILTDSGVFQYEDGERRQYARGTAAHNTVVIDNLDQAELWRSFRMGRRGKPTGFALENRSLRCSHNGFSLWKKDVRHERTLSLLDSGFSILDKLNGPGQHRYDAFFHFAPDAIIEKIEERKYQINNCLLIELLGAQPRLTTSEYYPEFGRSIIRPCLILNGIFERYTSFELRFSSIS